MRQLLEEPPEPPVVGPEVVAPVGDAVGLVADQRERLRLHRVEDAAAEPGVGEPLGRNEQQVDLIASDLFLGLGPAIDVGRVDGDRDQAESFGGRDLVAHQCEQR